ncbi:MAG: accessory gene regulator B family protein [Bacteroides sp.]|nr:accessory gene regulator B family protein [Bacteroides sp.]MCM1549427.1 accessory gene regulator B family protein [Clostridium sp.]
MANISFSNHPDSPSEYEKKFIRYWGACLLSEGSKIIIFAIIFFSWNKLPEFGTALLFLFLFRSCTGGLHCKNYFSCLCLSFLILLSGILLGDALFLPKYLILFLTAALGLLSCLLTPILSTNRPPATPAIIRHARKRTLIISILLFIFLWIFSGNQYWNIGFWMFVMNALQLFTAYMIRRWHHVSVNQDVNLVS